VPSFIGRLLSRFRRVRLVRFHCVAPALNDRPGEATIEGFLIGRWGGHYILERAKLLEAEDRTVSLDGRLEIPVERVFFRQVLEKDARL
jgi:hypothetical protein